MSTYQRSGFYINLECFYSSINVTGAVELVGSNGDDIFEPLQQLRDIIVDAICRNTSLAERYGSMV